MRYFTPNSPAVKKEISPMLFICCAYSRKLSTQQEMRGGKNVDDKQQFPVGYVMWVEEENLGKFFFSTQKKTRFGFQSTCRLACQSSRRDKCNIGLHKTQLARGLLNTRKHRSVPKIFQHWYWQCLHTGFWCKNTPSLKRAGDITWSKLKIEIKNVCMTQKV